MYEWLILIPQFYFVTIGILQSESCITYILFEQTVLARRCSIAVHRRDCWRCSSAGFFELEQIQG